MSLTIASARGLERRRPDREVHATGDEQGARLLCRHTRFGVVALLGSGRRDTISDRPQLNSVARANYLMSHGIREDEASKLILNGFIEPIIKELRWNTPSR